MKKPFRLLALLLCIGILTVLCAVGCGKTPDTPSSGISGDDPSGSTSDGTDDPLAPSGSDRPSDADPTATGAQPGVSDNKTTAAGGTKATTGKTTAPAQNGKRKTIRFASVWYDLWYDQPVGTNEHSDLFREVFSQVEKKYNVKIELSAVNDTNMDIIARAITAGSAPYELMELGLNNARRLAMANCWYDQSKMPGVSLGSSAFKDCAAIVESMSFGGKAYGSAFGYPYGSMMGVFANLTLLRRYQQPDVLQLYQSGKWDFTQFKTIAKAVTRDTDNDGATDVWGIACGTEIVGMAFTANAGGTVIRDKNGKYEAAMLGPKGIAAAKWLQSIYVTDRSYNYVTAGARAALEQFADGKVAFVPTYLQMVDGLTEMKDDYAFLPFPKGPDQSDHLSGVYDGKVYVIPKTVSDAETVGKVYQAIAEAAAPRLSAMYKDRLIGYGMDEKSAALTMTFAKYLTPEFAEGVDSAKFSDKINNSIFSKNGDPASAYESIREQFQKAVEDYYG